MLLRRKQSPGPSDEELVLALRGGHRSALGLLWDRYAHLLYGVGMKYLKDADRSKDEVTELFAALPALLERHSVDRFRPWVHTVMRNRCLVRLRKDGRTARIADDHLADHLADESEEGALREASLQQLERAIAGLTNAQRTCITLFHLQRNSYQQTAARTGLSIEQVRSHLQNGRRNLRLILLRHADQERP